VSTLFLGVAVVVVLASCGDDANDQGLRTGQRAVSTSAASTSADGGSTGTVVQVVAIDNTFRPEVIEIEVGDEVRWENRGLNEHNVLYVQDAASPFGVEVAQFQPGDAYTHVFTEPGEFDYYCSIHGNETVGMVGTVVVSG
jgi:plastocyanin